MTTVNLGMDGFVTLHAKATAGELPPAQREEYRFLREAFLAAMVDLQNAALADGRRRRAAVRARRAVQVELASGGRTARTLTLDVGLGGFSALLPEAPAAHARLRARLRVSAERWVSADVVVVSARRRQRAAHVSFAFAAREGDWAVFEDLVIDHLISDLGAGRRTPATDGVMDWLRDAGRADVLRHAG